MVIAAAAVLALAGGIASPAAAKGCLKGAAVGGLAGHMAGHGVLGAAGGCAVGHHMANKKERQAQTSGTTTSAARPSTGTTSPNTMSGE
ncbi:MAG: hypothetical protein JSS43_27130 [Proteobacteria bacterium]|nr:hypothetical protein [Pseudomonadota bacterium]